jgi:phosphoenolpyruvate carboxykinase (ATP)
VHSGELSKGQFETMPVFGLEVPTACSGVPSEILMPSRVWSDQDLYKQNVNKLANLFTDAFEEYKDKASDGVIAAGPKPSA